MRYSPVTVVAVEQAYAKDACCLSCRCSIQVVSSGGDGDIGITGNLLRSDCSGVRATESGLELAFKRSRA